MTDEWSVERRGVLGGLKVPFSWNGLLVGVCGVLAFVVGNRFAAAGTHEPRIAEKFFSQLLDLAPGCRDWLLGLFPYLRVGGDGFFGGFYLSPEAGAPLLRLSPADTLIYGAFILFLWSVVSVAIGRITALKIARDDSLGWSEALLFGLQKGGQTFLAVAVVLGFTAFFYFIMNGWVAGGVARFLGWNAAGVKITSLGFPLVMISTFLVCLLLYHLVLGSQLIASTIATESSDAFDGLSRSFSFVYNRAWQAILYPLLIAAYVLIVLYFAKLLLHASFNSVLGVWLGQDLSWLPGDASALGDWRRMGLGELAAAGGSAKVVYFWVMIFKLLVAAYIIQYVASAYTAVYFVLRRDVDGEEYNEIFIEDEDPLANFQPLEVGQPAPDAAPAAPPAAPAPVEEAPTAKTPSGRQKKAGASGRQKKAGASGRQKKIDDLEAGV